MINYFLNILHGHELIATFFTALIGGEPAVLFLSFLSAQGFSSVWIVLFFAYTTALLAEIFWFLLGRSKLGDVIENKFFSGKTQQEFITHIRKVEEGRSIRMLILARFISGFTILAILYFGRKKISLKRFIGYCMVVNLVWSPIVTLVGWSAGHGFKLLYETLLNIQLALTILAFSTIAIYLIYKLIEKYFLRKKVIENIDKLD